jgi:Cu-Zn family superoxide dismutase
MTARDRGRAEKKQTGKAKEWAVLRKVLLGAVAVGVAAVATPAVVMAATGGHQANQASQASKQAAMPAADAMQGGDGGAGHHRVHVVLRNANGAQIGYVNLTSSDGAILVSVHAWSLMPGFHGFHIHSMGVCNPATPAPFTSAGGHFNPTGTAEGMQAGAFPVLLANADGTATASFRDGNFTLKQLSGPTGSSIVVHAMPDNYANIPARYTAGGVAGPDMETQMTGDGGTRVACGVIAAPMPGPASTASPSPMMSTQEPSQQPTMPAPMPSQPMPTTPGTPTSQPTPAPTGTTPAPTPAPTESQPPTPTPSAGPTHF